MVEMNGKKYFHKPKALKRGSGTVAPYSKRQHLLKLQGYSLWLSLALQQQMLTTMLSMQIYTNQTNVQYTHLNPGKQLRLIKQFEADQKSTIIVK